MRSSPLTTKKVAKLQPRDRRYTVSDGFGLCLRVHPSGTKSFVLRLSNGGRVTDVLLGHWPEMSLMQARQEARRRRKDAELEPPRGYVLRDAFRIWCNLKRGRIVSYEDEKRRLERYVMKPIGNRQIDEITAPLVIQTVKSIESAGHQATLKRVLMRTREIMDLAVCAGYVQHNPIERISRIFAPPIVKPMPSVHWQELPNVMTAMKTASERTQLLFLWSCMTLLRPAEAVKVRADWIDGDTLTIPSDEMKKRRPHRVPILPAMRTVLGRAKDLSPHPRSPFVWSGRKAGTHMSSQTIAKHLHQTAFNGRLVAHGLRSIGRSWLADHGAPFEAAEACLAHVAGSGVSRAYQRSDYLDQRRTLMSDWCTYVIDCAGRADFLTSILDEIEDAAV